MARPCQMNRRGLPITLHDLCQTHIDALTALRLVTVDGECDLGCWLEQRARSKTDFDRHVAGGEAAFRGRGDTIDIEFHVLVVINVELEIRLLSGWHGELAPQPDVAGAPASPHHRARRAIRPKTSRKLAPV